MRHRTAAASGWTAATLLAIAGAGAGLAVLAFRFHPVGDYFTESDFYGAYAVGAAGLQHGRFEAWRYGVYGPVYELLLALFGAFTPELFSAARLLSIVAAVGVLAAAAWMARRRFGAAAAFWLVALIAVEPTFVRYGYSATSDMAGFALWTGAAALLLEGGGAAATLAAGALAGLAALTRYNLAVLLPAGLVVLALARQRGERKRALVRFSAAFAIAVLPFTLWATLQGHPPGAVLLQDAGFYLTDAPQVALEQRVAHPDGVSTPSTHAGIGQVVTRAMSGLPLHVGADARVLLGFPVTALVVLGLAWATLRKRVAPLLGPAILALAALVAVAPIFYTERYSMVVLPLALLPAAVLLGGEPGAPPNALVRALLGVATLALTLRACVALQRQEYASIPVEALGSGRMLRAIATPGERVLARKAHVAWVAGLEPVLFPDCPSLDSLASFCRQQRVHYLYYSWFEARLRPRFRYLLDTTATVPGLKALAATADKPSATYEIGPGFGARPAWSFDPAQEHEIAQHVEQLMSGGGP
jgi:hypothetical protein